MELLKLLNTKELIAQIICFLVLLAVMRIFLWKKVLAILDKRKDAISSEFKTLDERKKALSDVTGQYEKRIADIDIEARERIQEALVQARGLADGIRAKAELDADKIIENAKATIKDEVSKAREELKEQVVDIAIQVAEKVIQEKLSENSDRRLVEDFIKGIEEK